ncbi:hypothetical protein [Microcoleus sp. MON2_D5]|uniref:hypothetical protein n=1 Tax=Microcoleus sp. MON2_D5 TaxID=2818833 RepID=UPI002FD5651E
MPASTIAPGAVGLIVVDRERTFLTARSGYPTRSPPQSKTLGKHISTGISDRT